jgi:hypothetical protein
LRASAPVVCDQARSRDTPAWGASLRAAGQIAHEGSFAALDGAASFAELNRMFDQRSPV